MRIFSICSRLLGENTFLVEKEGNVLIVDPGVSGESIFAACAELRAKPIAVLLTHGHYDHICGAPALSAAGLKIYAGEEELDVVNGRANLALVFGKSLPTIPLERGLADGENLSLPPFSVQVIHTPGHTKGSVCYLIDGALFSGDTLFEGSYGRADLPTGDSADLLCSVANTLFELPQDTPVYAWHSASPDPASVERMALASPDTTIGKEYSTNPILDLL